MLGQWCLADKTVWKSFVYLMPVFSSGIYHKNVPRQKTFRMCFHKVLSDKHFFFVIACLIYY